MVGHGGSSAGSYIADPTSPIPSHCASIVTTSTARVKRISSHLSEYVAVIIHCKLPSGWALYNKYSHCPCSPSLTITLPFAQWSPIPLIFCFHSIRLWCHVLRFRVLALLLILSFFALLRWSSECGGFCLLARFLRFALFLALLVVVLLKKATDDQQGSYKLRQIKSPDFSLTLEKHISDFENPGWMYVVSQ